jgi:hypothetical protein
METRYDQQKIGFDAEKESVRKFAQPRAMHVLENNWELVRILRHAIDGSFEFCAEASSEPSPLRFVPILGVTELCPGGGRKDYLHR